MVIVRLRNRRGGRDGGQPLGRYGALGKKTSVLARTMWRSGINDVLVGGSNTWSSANENLFFDGNAGYGPCTAVDTVDQGPLAPIEDVEAHVYRPPGVRGPDNLYIGPVVRGQITYYVPYTSLDGKGYGYILSG